MDKGEVSWSETIFIALFCLPILAALIYIMLNSRNLENVSDSVLAECRRLATKHVPGVTDGIDVAVVPVGPGGRASRASETLVLWKNDELDVDVKCIGRVGVQSQAVKIRSFVSNGESIKIMSKREER